MGHRIRSPQVGAAMVALVLSAPAGAQAPDSTSAHPSPRPAQLTERFPVGETLVYDAKFGFLSIGGARTQVVGIDTVRGTPTLHIRFLLEGGTFFYRLNDRMDSWVGLDDFASRRFTQDFDEGGKQRSTAYDIFPDSGFYRQAGVDTVRKTSNQPLDDAAFFYFARTVPLEPGQRYEFDRYFRPDRNPVVLEVLGRDTIDVPAGRFPALVVRPIIKGGGIFAERADGRMWISDDERRLLVQIKSTFSFGTITLRLIRIETHGEAAPGKREPGSGKRKK